MSSVQYEFTDRYDALGIRPDPETACKGQCEGTGVVPIVGPHEARPGRVRPVDTPESTDDMEQPWRSLWLEAEQESPAENGWHFVKCPECQGTGKRQSNTR